MSSKSWNGESSYISYQNKNLVVSPSGEVIELPQQRKQQTQRQDAGSQSNQKKNLVVSPSGQVVELPYPFETINLPQHRSQQKDLEQQTSNKLQQRHQDPIIKRHMSLEFLNPVHECHSRKSSIIVAVVNLVATVCGGGVLSLPFAFRRAGIIPTTIMMIYGFVSTDFTLYILISCARRTGGRSYGDVAKAAFGNAAEVFTTALMGVMLLGSLTAYLVLVKDIWTPVVMFVLPTVLKQLLVEKDILYDNNEDNEQVASKEGGNFILLCILILGTPLLLKNDLHALRHTCYVGFSSCALLVVALVYHAYAAVQLPRPIELNWYSTNLSDLAFCFPIIVLCFFCSYNALGVHSSLLNPTRERVKFVLDSSMLICWTLFYLGGLGGYIYALDETSDNILMNFSFDDPAIFLARIGYCFTLLFGLPLITLPCRESLRAVPGQIRAWRLDAALAKEFSQVDVRRAKGAHLVINGVDFDELDPILVTKDPEKQHQTMLMLGNQHDLEHVIGGDIDADNETAETVSEEADTAGGTSKLEFSNRDTAPSCRGGQFIHCVSTLAVVGFCYSAAVSVPSVGFVWSLCGSSMAIIIAFIIPTACYLKIREHKQRNPRSIFSWMLLIISMIAAPICTQQAIVNA